MSVMSNFSLKIITDSIGLSAIKITMTPKSEDEKRGEIPASSTFRGYEPD